jgi:hypothetical protein
MSGLRPEDVEWSQFSPMNDLTLPCWGPHAVTPRTKPCPVCLWGFAFVRWEKKGRLKASAGTECLFCQLIMAVVDSYAPELDEMAGIGIYHYGKVIDVAWLAGDRSGTRIAVYDVPDLGPYASTGLDPPEQYDSLQDIIGDTSSDRAIELAKGWLKSCDTHHKVCERGRECCLPNRVLDLDPFGDHQNIRLYETNEESAPYVCLSHCWGTTTEMFKTERENLPQRIECIKLDSLPKTFQDAVIFTRAINVRCLWIDSLCVIQGDENDWLKEGLQMHKIYGNAYLTIAASKSTGPSGGLFSAPSPECQLRKLSLPTKEGVEQIMQMRRRIYHFDTTEAFPLLQRGWVFQERIISRRMLHFAQQELIWECMETEDCECGFVQHCLGAHSSIPRKSMYLRHREEPKFHQYIWREIVASYSALKLTYEKDIFLALAGVAQDHMTTRRSRYLAGLWEDSLPKDLLWYTRARSRVFPGDDPNKLTVRPSPGRAPSWSWASVETTISYDEHPGFSPALTIHAANVTPVGCDIRGEIVVSGLLASVTVHQRTEATGSSVGLQVHGQKVAHLASYPDYDWGSDEEWWITEGQTLYCLYLGTTFDRPKTSTPDSEEDIFDSDDKLWFLILARFAHGDNAYQRVGIATLGGEYFKENAHFIEAFVKANQIVIY